MSLLCMAVQNSQTMVGLVEDGELVAHWRVHTDDRRTCDDWGLLVGALLNGRADSAGVEGVCICSAVPAALRALRAATAQYLPSARTVIVGPGVKTGLPVLTDNPREVGTDRVANAVAALARFGAPSIVVDAGTATTFDVVNERGQYVGGAIAPGMQISLEALESHGAQLRQVEVLVPRSVIAKNTVEAIQAGAVFGFAGQVDAIVARIVAELGTPVDRVEVVGTGEFSAILADQCSSVRHCQPWLTLDGLRLLYERNA
jgi:type III pantothenate kinase